ncbi:MAG: hypothetical protein JXD23_10435 [Spirochaetales bacterium]|nr:hypothetical protein [Spirochaetales bacterium]
MTVFLAGCAAVAGGALLALAAPAKLRGVVYSIGGGAGLGLCAAAAIPVLLSCEPATFTAALPFPFGPVGLALDPLAAFFVLILSLSNFTAGLYSIGYVQTYPAAKSRLYYPALGVLFLAMLLLVAVRQAVAFLFLWEIMSLSSFALVAFEHEKEETRKAAIYYLVAMQAGFAFLLTGFVVLTHAAGGVDFSAFPAVLSGGGPLAAGLFLILFVGFAAKAGFVPFHTWLPRAHPAAPAPVSAVMSGVMIKTGIYGLLRLIQFMGNPPLWLSCFILILSLLSGILGVVYAVAQHDLKKLLAYHSIENIGIIGLGIGVGMIGLSLGLPAMAFLGFFGGLLHVLNHSLFKGLLFMGAGSVYLQTHTRNMEKLGGLAKAMPKTAALFLIGSLAISGLPLLNGFVSEFAIYLGLLRGLPGAGAGRAVALVLSLAGLALIGVLALLCFVKAFGATFLGLPREQGRGAARDGEPFGLIAQLVTAALIVVIGLLPRLTLPLMTGLVSGFAGAAGDSPVPALDGIFSSLSKGFLVFAAAGGALLGLRALLLRKRTVTETKTWDCGCQRRSGRLQYTAGSFSWIVRGFFAPLLGFRTRVKTEAGPAGLPPPVIEAATEGSDAVERLALKPFVKAVRTFLKFFSWVQSGNTQQYILYGIVFLTAIIILIFGLGG